MNNNLSPLTTETLANLSGMYSTTLWDTIYEVSGSLETVKGLQTVAQFDSRIQKISKARNGLVKKYE